jgi:hypothetical protein
VPDKLSPGALMLSGQASPPLEDTSSVNIVDLPHLGTPPFTFQLTLPRQGSSLGCQITADTYHNLPYICDFLPGTPLATSLLLHGRPNSSIWILSINSREFFTAKAVVTYIASLQDPFGTTYAQTIFARRIASTRTSLESNRVLFNQVHLAFNNTHLDKPLPSSVIVPVSMKVVSSPIRPPNPKHFGETLSTPFATDWRDALFQNYDKMMRTGTFYPPMLCSSVPLGKRILRSRVACKVKGGPLPNQYDLYACTCADDSSQKEFIDFFDSYSPVASIDSIRVLLNIAASSGLIVSILDISNVTAYF